MIFAEHILNFLQGLKITARLPTGVEVMNPYQNGRVFQLCEQFYRKFYNDSNPRTLILGINPGRFGGGLTGIPFTDPVKLDEDCAILNTLSKKVELSADFIYTMIHALGGPSKFYTKFYFSSISPLGFTKDGKNLNYYDIKELQESLMDFIILSLTKQLEFGINQNTCFCLGESDNFKFLNKLNQQHHFFQKIVPLAHPRFIMQYRKKKKSEYIEDYRLKLNS